MKPSLFLFLFFSISSLAFAFSTSNPLALPSTWTPGDTMHSQIAIDSNGPFNISFTPSINGSANTSEFILNSSQLNCTSNGTVWDCGNYSQLSAGHYVVDFYLTPSFYLVSDNYKLDFDYTAFADEPSPPAPAAGPVYYSTGGSFYGSAPPPYYRPAPKPSPVNQSSNQSPAQPPAQIPPNPPKPSPPPTIGPTAQNEPPINAPNPTLTPDLTQSDVQPQPKFNWAFIAGIAICIFALLCGIIWWIFFRVKKP